VASCWDLKEVRVIRKYAALWILGLGSLALHGQSAPGYGWSSFGVLPLKGVDFKIFKTPTRYIIHYVKNGFPTPDGTNGHGRAFSTDLKTWTVDQSNVCQTAGDYCTPPVVPGIPIEAGVWKLPDGRFRTYFSTTGAGLTASMTSADGLVWKRDPGVRMAPDPTSIYERGDFTMTFVSFLPLADGSVRMYYLGDIAPGTPGTPAWYNQDQSFNGVILKPSCVILSAISKDDGLTWVREAGVRINPLVQGPVRNQLNFDRSPHAEIDASDLSAVMVKENGKTVYRIYASSWGSGTVSYVSADGLSFVLEGQVPADRGDPKAVVMEDGRTWLVTNQYPDGVNDTIVYGPQSLFLSSPRAAVTLPVSETAFSPSPYAYPFRTVTMGITGTATGPVTLEATDGSVSNCVPGPCAFHPEYFTFTPSSGTPPFSTVVNYVGPATNYSNDMLVVHAKSANTTAAGAIYCMNEILDRYDTSVFCKGTVAELPMNRLDFALAPGTPAASQVSNILSLGGPGYPFTASSSVPWATVSPTAGVAPLPLTVTVNPAGLAPGTYTGTVTITAEGTTEQITVSAVVAAGPVITSVRNAASSATTIAPNSFITIFGSGFAAAPEVWSPTTSLPTVLGGARVKVNGKDAFLSYASPGQLNVLTPPDTASGPVVVQVTTAAGTTSATATMTQITPSWFAYTVGSRTWLAALIGSTATYVAPVGSLGGVVSRSARAGDFLALYANGLGATSPTAPTGVVLDTAYPLNDLSRVKVTVGGKPATVQFAGLVAPGLYQVNIQVPSGIGTGELQVEMFVDGQATQGGVTLNFQ
jgi:uncharacterized protein (TIGR03437 family)